MIVFFILRKGIYTGLRCDIGLNPNGFHDSGLLGIPLKAYHEIIRQPEAAFEDMNTRVGLLDETPLKLKAAR